MARYMTGYDEDSAMSNMSSSTNSNSDSEAVDRWRTGLAAGRGTGVKKVTTKTKTVATPGTKVSQATVDKIKAMGMKKALAGAGTASAEMREGLKRMYGAKRVGASVKPSTAGTGRAKLGPAKSADAARASARSKPKSSSTGGYPRSTAKTTSTGTKSGGMTKKNVGSRLADAVTGKGKPTGSARAAEQAKLKKAWDIAMAKKKGK
jgi:hypothetical protein